MGDRPVITNWVSNVVVTPREVQSPTSFEELKNIFIRAAEDDTTIKAVGSLHSSSDIIDTQGILVQTHGLRRILAPNPPSPVPPGPAPLRPSTLRPERSPESLIQVECGIAIRDLIAALEHRGLALPNLGSYDGQTIIGAISTSTHGSGIRLGSLASYVESIVLVAEGGAVYQIEPTSGITDPAKFDSPGVTLKQDDDWFYSTVVGMGCMGIVYSVVLRVRSRYWIQEARTVRPWGDVKATDFEVASPRFRDETLRTYEILINPYAVGGDRNCLVTCRRELAAAPPFSIPHFREFFPALLASVPVGEQVIVDNFNAHPELTPQRLDAALHLLETPSASGRSFDMLLLGQANYVPAYASELAVPVDRCVDVVETIFAIADQLRRRPTPLLHTSPFALRFVAPSKHYLSPQYGGDDPNGPFAAGTCMIEFPCLVGTRGLEEILLTLEEGLRPLGARPHFGQWNRLRGGFALLEAFYPKVREWRRVYRELNPSGTTNNAFTRRCTFDTAD